MREINLIFTPDLNDHLRVLEHSAELGFHVLLHTQRLNQDLNAFLPHIIFVSFDLS